MDREQHDTGKRVQALDQEALGSNPHLVTYHKTFLTLGMLLGLCVSAFPLILKI
jgi:hypothetical protein